MAEVSRKQAKTPLVLALDIGSSATRGRIFDAQASTIKKLDHRVRHEMTAASDGTNIADADEIVAEVVQTIDALLHKAGKQAAGIAGVALDTFAATLVGVDRAGEAITPLFTYADSRPAPFVQRLKRQLDEHAVQQRTGCRFHASYLPARLLWLAATEPDLAGRVDSWMSLGEYVYLKLIGQRGVSISSAAWSGLLNRHTLAWDEELIEHLPVRPEQLAPLHDTTEPLQSMTRQFSRRWPALKEAAWFPAIADGYASNVGSGAGDPTVLALSAGTSGAVRVLLSRPPATVPAGLWCYAVDRSQSLLGGALNDAGRGISWLRGLLNLPGPDRLLEVLKAPPRADTPSVLPFLTGERSPGWAGHATASFTGMDLHTTPDALYRATLEGIGHRYALIAGQIRTVSSQAERMVASGGAAERQPAWLQILADMLELPAALSLESQATLRGTAEIALEVLAPDRKRPPAPLGETYRPNPANAAVYRESRKRQEAEYRCLVAERQPFAPDEVEGPVSSASGDATA